MTKDSGEGSVLEAVAQDTGQPGCGDLISWALCPHLRLSIENLDKRPQCMRCPAFVYYISIDRCGTSFCRYLADKARDDVLALLQRNGPQPERMSPGNMTEAPLSDAGD